MFETIIGSTKVKNSKKNQERWIKKEFKFFWISAYSPELNLIKTECHRFKTYQLFGRMFEDKYNLAIAVIDGIERRSKKNCVCVYI